MEPPLIRLDRVVKRFGRRRVLDGLSWELRAGECAVILGPSGGGKTVFLHTLLGLHAPDEGQVDRAGLGPDPFRAMAVMFQEDALLDDRTVAVNLATALLERADLFEPPADPAARAAIDAVLREVDLNPETDGPKLPSALSGGMRRRVALARALIRRPRLLIADEPTTGLDPTSSALIYDLLGRLIRQRGMSAVIITHDPACASRLGYPVYFFSPVEGTMPRWTPPDPGRRDDLGAHDEQRHHALQLWMRDQLDSHRRRRSEAGQAKEPAADLPTEPAGAAGAARFINDALEALGRSALLLARLAGRFSPALLLRGLRDWGLGSLPLVALIFLLLGVVMQVQAESAVVDYGLSNRLPELVALSLLRLSPILTGFLLAGRCGSAIGAHVGFMELSGQRRALWTMRIDPDRTLFPPLFWSLTLAAPLLALIGMAAGAAAAIALLGLPVSRAQITPTFFLRRFPTFLSAGELGVLVVKSMLMGGGLAAIAYGLGARPKRSPADVTRAITLTLVLAFVWMTLVDAALSLLFPN
ncbi:MAG TPA: ABC transporter permease [Candidatus Sumerlaeota bacterium]|nr:ABC transporter permease [Candidatus Sumerlaeota bacterium]